MNSVFVLVFRSGRSQMFLKIDLLKQFRKFQRKPLVLEARFHKAAGPLFCNFVKMRLQYSCFPVKLAKFLRAPSFTEHLLHLLLQFLQQNNLTLGYNQKLLWKYYNYYHPPYIKISISNQKYGNLVQKFCSFSRQSPNFMTLSSIYFCIISIFLRKIGVSHSDQCILQKVSVKQIAQSTRRRTHLCL